MNDKRPVSYPFKTPNSEIGYNLFPALMEDHESVFFHGTAEGNLLSIIETGFLLGKKTKSVSFARKSGLALSYACSARSKMSPNGCVIAVQIDDVKRNGIKSDEEFGLHVYTLDPPPLVIGYCIIPSSYDFV
ncbi:MAG: hypothetical protein GY844_27095 [Bradyrhizobium sp.]|nr:hypothetical protein [Bradyrhizobium sp.]